MLDAQDVAEMKAEIRELRAENEKFRQEIDDLKDEIKDLEEAECDECRALQAELDEIEDPETYIDAIGEIRRLVARGDHRDAIDYADRFLPRSLRYAA